MLEKLVLAEIEGKNKAIHAYDDIVWKIRSGFLTLLLGGWAIVLKGIVESPQFSADRYQSLVGGLLLFTIAFAFGAWHIDRAYLHRKFRVILALNHLVDVLVANGGDATKVPVMYLKIAGDATEMPFDSAGYRQARSTELAVYVAPLVLLIAGVGLVIR